MLPVANRLVEMVPLQRQNKARSSFMESARHTVDRSFFGALSLINLLMAGPDSGGLRAETAGTVRDRVPRGARHLHPLRDTALQPQLHGEANRSISAVQP